MSLFTKLANAIFSPVDTEGNKRDVDNLDAQRPEQMVSVLLGSGASIPPMSVSARSYTSDNTSSPAATDNFGGT